MTHPGGVRRVFQSTAIYTIGLVLQRALSLVMLPLYTSYIRREEYAIIDTLDTAVALFGILFGARFSGALMFHYSAAEDDQGRRNVLTTAYFGGALLGLVGGAIGYLCAPWIGQLILGSQQYTHPLRIMFATFALNIPIEIGWAWVRVENRSILFVAATLCQMVLLVVLNVFFIVYLEWGYISLMWTALISYSFLFCGFVGGLRWKRTGQMDLGLLWRMIKFTAPLGVTVLAAFMFHSGDRFFLVKLVPLGDLGEYALAYKIGMLASLVGAAFNQYWSAQVFVHIRGENGPREFSRIFSYIFMVSVFVSFGIWAFSYPLLTKLTDSAYHRGIAYIPWLLLAYNIRTAADFLRSLLYAKNAPGTDAVAQGAAGLFCLAAYSVLIPRFGVWGAVAATIAGFGAVLVLTARPALRMFPFDFERGRLAKLAGIVVVLGVPVALQAQLPWMAQFLLAIGVSIAFPLLLLAVGFFDEDELSTLRSQWMSIRHRLAGQPAN